MPHRSRHLISTLLAGIIAVTSLAAETKYSIPVDPDLARKTQDAIRTAEQDGNYPAALREARRLLELFPNNPELQAPIYLVMSDAAEKSGDATRSALYLATAKQIEPGIEDQLRSGSGKTTRGGPNDGSNKMQNVMAAIAQGAQIAMQIQQQIQATKLARMQMDLAQQQARLQGTQSPVGQPGQIMYPAAPINAGNYQANPVQNGPMPGWGQPGAPQPIGQDPSQLQAAQSPQQIQYPQPGTQNAPQPIQYPQPTAQPIANAQPMGQPIAYPQAVAQPIGQPGDQQTAQPIQYPAPTPGQTYPAPVQTQQPLPQQAQMSQGQQQQIQQQQGQYQQQPINQYGQPAQQQGQLQQGQQQNPQQFQRFQQRPMQRQNPYGAGNYQNGGMRTRGEKPLELRVVHDHYRAGDKAFFNDLCGAILSVDGGNLTFTATGGEAPVMIPAADILEIRMNAMLGRSSGAFHISTRKGLYIDVVMESGSRDDAGVSVDQLRKKLALEE